MSSAIRNNMMYDMQDTFDDLYARAKNGDNFYKLIEIIKSPNNITTSTYQETDKKSKRI